MKPQDPSPAQPRRVGMISLGCAKNLVDAEVMLGSILERGFAVTSDPEEADLLIVNTCAFIDSAKEESIAAILEAHNARGLRRRPGQKLLVAGCMAQRFSKELAEEMPEVDAFMGLDQIAEAGEIVARLLANPETDRRNPLDLVTRKPVYIPDYDTPRFRLTPPHTAYLKIAEGCNHPCSFCVIPQMRGRHRSRSLDSVLREARRLVAEGVREINLISQDTTYYGMDRWEEKAGPRQPVDSSRGENLCTLLLALQEIEGEFWIRILYTHPAHWSDELIRTIAACPKVARYVDMPLQHIHPVVLDRMRRETGTQQIVDLIQRIRAGIPGIAIRTTFIVGFPGETKEQFEFLLDFIRSTRFERLGVFAYSQEEGSRAAKFPDQVPARVRNARYRRAMQLQQRIAAERNATLVGRTVRALADQPLVARGEHDAPDIDGRILLSRPVPAGGFFNARITGARVYDLLADPVD